MRPINDSNIDEIMFQLLEGEITGREKEQLLEAIQADPAYLALWNAWQQTILKPESDLVSMDISGLKKKTSLVIPLFLKYAVAAMLVIAVSFGIFYSNDKSDKIVPAIVDKPSPKNPRTSRLPQLDKDTFSAFKMTKDTFVPMKEKVKYMVNQGQENKVYPSIDSIKYDAPNTPVFTKNIEVPVLVKTPEKSEKLELKKDNPEDVIVFVSTEKTVNSNQNTADQNTEKSLFARIFGTSKIKIVDDENTRTQKKIILENKKYQIIAGF